MRFPGGAYCAECRLWIKDGEPLTIARRALLHVGCAAPRAERLARVSARNAESRAGLAATETCVECRAAPTSAPGKSRCAPCAAENAARESRRREAGRQPAPDKIVFHIGGADMRPLCGAAAPGYSVTDRPPRATCEACRVALKKLGKVT